MIEAIYLKNGRKVISVASYDKYNVILDDDCWALSKIDVDDAPYRLIPGVMETLKMLPSIPNEYEPLMSFIEKQRGDNATTKSQIDELIIVDPSFIGTPLLDGGAYKTTHDIYWPFQFNNVVPNSFTSNYPVIVNYKKGCIRIPAGSWLNHSTIGHPIKFDSICIICSYSYCE